MEEQLPVLVIIMVAPMEIQKNVLGAAMLVEAMDKTVLNVVPVDSTMAEAVLKEVCVSALPDTIPMPNIARKSRLSTKKYWQIRMLLSV
jgi:hypothetical protein